MSTLAIDTEISLNHDLVVPNSGLTFHLLAVLPASLQDEAWRLYRDAFDCLRTAAVQRHVLYREEFDAVMNDPRVIKYLGFDGPAPGAALLGCANAGGRTTGVCVDGRATG